MDLTPYLESLRRDLLQAAALGDENTQRTAVALAGAVEPGFRLALMNALSDLAGEITGALGDTTVDVRLDGKEVRVLVERHEEPEWDAEPGHRAHRTLDDVKPEDMDRSAWAAAMREAGSELSRTTVRLLGDLKSQAESAASDQGVSLNTYISRAVSDSVRGKGKGRGQQGRTGRGRDGRTVSGWIQG